MDAVQFFKPGSSFAAFYRFLLCKGWKPFAGTELHLDSQQTLAASVGQQVRNSMKIPSRFSLVLILPGLLCPVGAQVTLTRILEGDIATDTGYFWGYA